jgi:hypothetical protein
MKTYKRIKIQKQQQQQLAVRSMEMCIGSEEYYHKIIEVKDISGGRLWWRHMCATVHIAKVEVFIVTLPATCTLSWPTMTCIPNGKRYKIFSIQSHAKMKCEFCNVAAKAMFSIQTCLLHFPI